MFSERKSLTTKLLPLKNKNCFECGDKFRNGHLKNCKAEGKTSYTCGKNGHLSAVCKSKTDKSSSNRKSKKSVFQSFEYSGFDEISENETCLFNLKEQNMTNQSQSLLHKIKFL